MKEQTATITLLPSGEILTAVVGDSLYTLLLVAGHVSAEQPCSDRLRLERGALSAAVDAALEEAIFSPAELAEGWVLASQRRILGDAQLTLYEEASAAPLQSRPLAKGYGLAVDLGNGTIVAGLVNLGTMHIPLLAACRNSQVQYGQDMQDRLQYCRQGEEAVAQLSQALRGDLDRLCKKLTVQAGIDGADIQAITIAGGCPMQRLLLQQSPLDCAPFERCEEVDSAALELRHAPAAKVYLLPTVARDLGADAVAAVLAADIFRKKDQDGLWLLLDFGVDSEVMIVGRGHILACSVPSAALEGMGIQYGMPSVAGAICEVILEEDVTLKTIRDARPEGISGAGLISAVNALLAQGMIDAEGKLGLVEDLPPALAARLRSSSGGREFVLSYADEYVPHDICINQDDILQLQMAKATIRAACSACLDQLGADVTELEGVLLAEAYRANLSAEAMLQLGMLPDVPLELVSNIGNASWQGAFLALSDRATLEEAERIAAQIEYLSLQANMVYAESFLQEMSFPR